MRTFLASASEPIKTLLAQLTEPIDQVGPAAYGAAMTQLGEQFVQAFHDRLTGIQRLLLVCTNEDADYLAQGVLNGLTALDGSGVGSMGGGGVGSQGVLNGLDAFGGPTILLACFWNDRETVVGPNSGLRVDLAPIMRRYVEPGEADAFLVVKSIISSACVVRTNITELVYSRNPARILIFAPVVLKGADEKLRQEFDEDVSRRFEFYWFAEDDTKEGETVVPGIGGQIYERLGIGSQKDKNHYTPTLVKERRRVSV